MALKSIVSVDSAVQQHLDRVSQHVVPQPRVNATRKARSGSEMLTDLYTRMDALLDEISVSDETPGKKAEAYGKVARIIKGLQADERRQSVTINNKPIEEMEREELEALVFQTLRGAGGQTGITCKTGKNNVDSPNQNGSRRDNTNSLKKTEKSQNINCESAPAKKNKRQQKRALQGAAKRAAAKSLGVTYKAQTTRTHGIADENHADDTLDELMSLLDG